VGKLEPNAVGLHDMHGNVYEWCHDTFAPYASTPLVEAFNPVTRGGSWESRPEMVRSSLRFPKPANWACDATGFRVVLVPRPKARSGAEIAQP
jgi:formylglycine-generating enzyme required for sulfatase activity